MPTPGQHWTMPIAHGVWDNQINDWIVGWYSGMVHPIDLTWDCRIRKTGLERCAHHWNRNSVIFPRSMYCNPCTWPHQMCWLYTVLHNVANVGLHIVTQCHMCWLTHIVTQYHMCWLTHCYTVSHVFGFLHTFTHCCKHKSSSQAFLSNLVDASPWPSSLWLPSSHTHLLLCLLLFSPISQSLWYKIGKYPVLPHAR